MDIAVIGPIAITGLVIAGLTMIVFILYSSWLAPTFQFNENESIPEPLIVDNLTVNQNALIDGLTVPQSATIDGLTTPSVQNAQGGVKFGLGTGLPVGFVQGTLIDYGTFTTTGNFTGPILEIDVPDIVFFVSGSLVTMVFPRFTGVANGAALLLVGTNVVPIELRPPENVKNSNITCTFSVVATPNTNVSAFCQIIAISGNILIAPNFINGVYSGTIFPAGNAGQPLIIENFSISWKI